jgi:hypothetical protein
VIQLFSGSTFIVAVTEDKSAWVFGSYRSDDIIGSLNDDYNVVDYSVEIWKGSSISSGSISSSSGNIWLVGEEGIIHAFGEKPEDSDELSPENVDESKKTRLDAMARHQNAGRKEEFTKILLELVDEPSKLRCPFCLDKKKFSTLSNCKNHMKNYCSDVNEISNRLVKEPKFPKVIV